MGGAGEGIAAAEDVGSDWGGSEMGGEGRAVVEVENRWRRERREGRRHSEGDEERVRVL